MCTDSSAPSANATWRVLGASVTGTGHRKRGKDCEDACDYRFHEASSLLLLAVADGAGEVIHAAEGAKAAVQAVLKAAELRLLGQPEPERGQWKSVLSHVLQLTRQRLEQLVEEHSQQIQHAPGKDGRLPLPVSPSLHDFATTLLLAIVTPHWLATLQVGDGAIVIYQQDGAITSLTPPSPHEFVNEAFFVTDTAYLSEAVCRLRFCPALRGIALLTDGLETVAMQYKDNSPFIPFFEPMFKQVQSLHMTEARLRKFLESDRISQRTDDDKTLLLAVRE